MIDFIANNWEGILAVITTVIAAASAIAALTPTPKDDAVLKVIRGIVDKLALNVKNV